MGLSRAQRAAICELSRVIIPVPIMGWVLRKAPPSSHCLSLSSARRGDTYTCDLQRNYESRSV